MRLFSMETWRPIPSLPEYLASSEGRIMCLPYRQDMPRGGWRIVGGIPTLGTWDGDRYVYFFKSLGRHAKIARLICEAFHGEAPLDKPYCLHRDENARNNRENNLYWGTQKENLNAPGFLAYCRARTGEDSPVIKARRKSA